MRWLLLFILLESCLVWFIYQNNQTKIQQHLQERVVTLQTAYTTLINSYRLLTDTLYSESINQPDVIRLFSQGLMADDERQRSLLRGKLYRSLYKTYARLIKRNLRQLHFHTATGDSYLRFHRPDMYGDNLFGIRPSLRIANQEQRQVFGFEAGRVYSGFRYVFPIFDDKHHIGSVETSLHFKAIEEELHKVIANAQFFLIMHSSHVFPALNQNERLIYMPSMLHSHYFYEDLNVKELGEPTPLAPLIQTINQQLTNDTKIANHLKNHDAFATHDFYQGKSYAITFIPIQDVSGQHAAYLLSYTPTPFIPVLQREFYIQLLGLSFILLLLIGFIYRISHDQTTLTAQKQLLTHELQRNQSIQHTLHASQLEFAGIFNSAPVGIGLLDTNGSYLKANPLFLKLLGYTWEELESKRCLDINHDDYVGQAKQALEQIVAGDIEHWNSDKRFVRKDGSVFWGNHWLSSILGKEGQCVAVICIISDLTEFKKNEEALRKFSRAVEQSNNSIVITDLDGTIEFVNPAFTRTSGYTAEEAIGNNQRILKSGKQDDAFYKALWNTLLSEKNWHGEFYNKRKNGELYWELATISPIQNEEGKVTHYLAIKENITERKESELELEQTNQELRRVNQEKNEFLAVAAHDLKNPLSAVRGFAEDIQDNYKDLSENMVVEHAARIRSAAQRMFMLITNLLDVNAIEAGKLSLNLVPQEISAVLQLTLDDYKLRAEQKNITLVFHNHMGLCHAQVDTDTLQQILDNLVSNALKYSPSGTTTQVHLCEMRDRIRIVVEDQGPGLSFEDQQRLFGKFTRLSAKPTAGEHSTGLGLFIVKKLVEAMKGQIWCESELDKGSKFIIEFEQVQVQQTNPALKTNLRILLAEDNLFSQKITLFHLKKLGLNADIAQHGKEVLQQLQQHNYDVILMDIEMPEMDGLQTTQCIRTNPQCSDASPYIIAMTGHADEQDKQHCLAAGMQDYLVKPFSQAALKQALKKVCT